MKRFYFKDEVIKVSKMYGSATRLCTIYELKKGDLEKVGEVSYNTASTMGAVSEVHKYLIDNKILSKALVKKQQNGTSYANSKKGYSDYYYGAYFTEDKTLKKYDIREI